MPSFILKKHTCGPDENPRFIYKLFCNGANFIETYNKDEAYEIFYEYKEAKESNRIITSTVIVVEEKKGYRLTKTYKMVKSKIRAIYAVDRNYNFSGLMFWTERWRRQVSFDSRESNDAEMMIILDRVIDNDGSYDSSLDSDVVASC